MQLPALLAMHSATKQLDTETSQHVPVRLRDGSATAVVPFQEWYLGSARARRSFLQAMNVIVRFTATRAHLRNLRERTVAEGIGRTVGAASTASQTLQTLTYAMAHESEAAILVPMPDWMNVFGLDGEAEGGGQAALITDEDAEQFAQSYLQQIEDGFGLKELIEEEERRRREDEERLEQEARARREAFAALMAAVRSAALQLVNRVLGDDAVRRVAEEIHRNRPPSPTASEKFRTRLAEVKAR